MPSAVRTDVERFITNFSSYDEIFFKSLSKNDHQWADGKKSHQSGIVIPREYIFFFGLDEAPSRNETLELDIDWFFKGSIFKRKDLDGKSTTLKFYCEGNRENRPEAHLTNVYYPYFVNIEDGSLIVVGRIHLENIYKYQAMIIDVKEEKILEEIMDILSIPEGLSWGVVNRTTLKDDFLSVLSKKALELLAKYGCIPSTEVTSSAVWQLLSQKPYFIRELFGNRWKNSKNIFESALENYPGDIIRWMLQNVEFELLKCIEKNFYPPFMTVEVKKEWNNSSFINDWDQLTLALGYALDGIMDVSKRITQSRRSRAGKSFERHIRYILEKNNIIFEEQVGEKRLDFQIITVNKNISLSAKTSIRERWKQVNDGSYFITLDRFVPRSKLEQICQRNIKLVVPEKDKDQIEHYSDNEMVYSFKSFFDLLKTM